MKTLKEETLSEFDEKYGKYGVYSIYSSLGTSPEYDNVKNFISQSLDRYGEEMKAWGFNDGFLENIEEREQYKKEAVEEYKKEYINCPNPDCYFHKQIRAI